MFQIFKNHFPIAYLGRFLLYALYFPGFLYFLFFMGSATRITETITQSQANQSPNRM
jgi:hypothetical protein